MTKRISALLVLGTITVLIFGTAGRLFTFALTGENNYDLLTNVLYPCEAQSFATSSKMVVMRLDDVQAYAWADISLRMMDDAKKRNVPLVLGVIPKDLKDDARMYSYLKEERCLHEIAQHGWDHNSETGGESPEFRGLSYEESLADIEKGKAVLESLARERLTTFIPPNNEMSVESLLAVRKAEIPVVSSEGDNEYDFGAATFDYDTDALTSVEDVLRDCAERDATKKVCVVMLHPQDFTTNGALDEVKYQVYINVLDSLKKEGYSFIRIKDLVSFDRTYHAWKKFMLF